jgi:hypothetical protein
MHIRPNTTPGQLVLLGVCVLGFGVLMGLRTSVENPVLRIAIAAVAFVLLFAGINRVRPCCVSPS